MGKMQRTKGKRGELEVAKLLRDYGFEGRRTAQYAGNTGEAADVIGIPGIHIEVKRQEVIRIHDWMKQAERDCHGKVPCVFHRVSREPWYCTLPLEDFLRILRNDRS